MKSYYKHVSISFFTVAIALMLVFFCKITPQVSSVEIMGPHFNEENSTAFTIVSGPTTRDELFWIKVNTVTELPWLHSLRLKTWACVSSVSVDGVERLSAMNEQNYCNDKKGVVLTSAQTFLQTKNSWSFTGATDGSNEYGILIDKDWSDPVLITAVALLALFVMGLSYSLLPFKNTSLRLSFTFLFTIAFLIRFWTVFLRLPAEDALYSDMLGYFYRGLEIGSGNYVSTQNFQPLGFTFWSMLTRALGGWELLNWLHVFASWGTVVVIFFLALEYFSVPIRSEEHTSELQSH